MSSAVEAYHLLWCSQSRDSLLLVVEVVVEVEAIDETRRLKVRIAEGVVVFHYAMSFYVYSCLYFGLIMSYFFILHSS